MDSTDARLEVDCALLAGSGSLATDGDLARLQRAAAQAGISRRSALRSLVAARRAENDEISAMHGALDRNALGYVTLDDALAAVSLTLTSPPSRALREALAMAFIELEHPSNSGRIDATAWRRLCAANQ